jgi:hypothetical protein
VDENCNRCHDKQPLPRFDHKRTAGFDLGRFHSKIACARCHGEKRNYKGLSGTCTACHSGWKAGSFNHSLTGVKLDENHSDLDCVSCHLELNYAKTPVCSDCHEDKSYPKAIPGIRVQQAQKSKR